MSNIKVTQKEIDRLMDTAEVHSMTEFGKCTVVTVKLENGFILTESSACVDPDNYNYALGKKLCMDRIESRLWELEGYALQRKVHELKEEAKMPTPPSLGSGSFGWAIECLKRGHRLRRRGWNGKGIFIKLQRPDTRSKMSHPYIYIDTTGLQTDNEEAPRSRVPWLASQTDMLAEDWELVPDGASGMPRTTGEKELVESGVLDLPEDSQVIRDPENEGTVWMELPDNLRLKFVDGRYAGWYTPVLEEALK